MGIYFLVLCWGNTQMRGILFSAATSRSNIPFSFCAHRDMNTRRSVQVCRYADGKRTNLERSGRATGRAVETLLEQGWTAQVRACTLDFICLHRCLCVLSVTQLDLYLPREHIYPGACAHERVRVRRCVCSCARVLNNTPAHLSSRVFLQFLFLRVYRRAHDQPRRASGTKSRSQRQAVRGA